jgi:hypothetical protein
VRLLTELAEENRSLVCFAGAGQYDHHQRVLHGVHALPAGSLAGHPAVHLRVPDHDLRTDGNGRG